MVRWPSNPARFALSDSGSKLTQEMNAAVWNTITSTHGWPAAVIAGEVLDLLSAPLDEAARIAVTAAPTRLSKTAVVAQFLRIEPQVIDAWVRSGTLPLPPWSEDLRSMEGLRGSVTAVWPELLEGARSGHKFAPVTNRLGVTTQKVAAAISRDPALRAELDEALMQGRDPEIKHGRRLAYRQGCWCPECRAAPLGPAR